MGVQQIPIDQFYKLQLNDQYGEMLFSLWPWDENYNQSFLGCTYSRIFGSVYKDSSITL